MKVTHPVHPIGTYAACERCGTGGELEPVDIVTATYGNQSGIIHWRCPVCEAAWPIPPDPSREKLGILEEKNGK